MMRPSIGRVVHYHAYGTPGGEYKPAPRAAIITEVDRSICDDTHDFAGTMPRVALCILNPTGMFFNTDVPYAAEPTPGHWSWPPRTF